LFCTIQVFVVFGITIVLNTVLSLFLSLGFLCSLMMLIGPVDNFGSCDVLWDLLCRRRKDDANVAVSGHVVGVTGTVVGTNANGRGDAYRWSGDESGGGYKWDTGEDDPDDPKKPQKGAPPEILPTPQTAASASSSADDGIVIPMLPSDTIRTDTQATATATEFDNVVEDNPNPVLEDSTNTVLQPPVRVSTPTRGLTEEGSQPQTLGRSASTDEDCKPEERTSSTTYGKELL
jgi:hypothetical protein